MEQRTSSKNQTIAILLAIFLGEFGVHRFYCGKVGTGILWLLTFGCFGIGWIVDIVMLATGKFKDSSGAYVKNTKKENSDENIKLAPATPASATKTDASTTVPSPSPEIRQETECVATSTNQEISHCDKLTHSASPVCEDFTKTENTAESEPTTPLIPKADEDTYTAFSTKIKRSSHNVEYEQIDELSHLDFKKRVGELGCFLNYSTYKIIGTNKQGKRCIKVCTGINQQQAIEKASKEGLIGPFETAALEHNLPTESQLKCLERHGTFVPEGVTKDDASCMISRLVDRDLTSPPPWLVDLATGLCVEFSAFIGMDGLFNRVICQTDTKDRAALYAYAVQQNMHGQAFGNMLEDPHKEKCYQFAELVVTNDSLQHSLQGRQPDDYKSPKKNTKIYRAAVAFLSGSKS